MITTIMCNRDLLRAFGRACQDWRTQETDYTQFCLAVKFGYKSATQISRFENGEANDAILLIKYYDMSKGKIVNYLSPVLQLMFKRGDNNDG